MRFHVLVVIAALAAACTDVFGPVGNVFADVRDAADAFHGESVDILWELNADLGDVVARHDAGEIDDAEFSDDLIDTSLDILEDLQEVMDEYDSYRRDTVAELQALPEYQAGWAGPAYLVDATFFGRLSDHVGSVEPLSASLATQLAAAQAAAGGSSADLDVALAEAAALVETHRLLFHAPGPGAS